LTPKKQVFNSIHATRARHGEAGRRRRRARELLLFQFTYSKEKSSSYSNSLPTSNFELNLVNRTTKAVVINAGAELEGKFP
jgi:hypothetical protein